MAEYCYAHPEARLKGAWHGDVYGFQTKAGQYRFYVRCFPLSEKGRSREQGDRTPPAPRRKKTSRKDKEEDMNDLPRYKLAAGLSVPLGAKFCYLLDISDGCGIAISVRKLGKNRPFALGDK